ncbi:hypothetical protein FIBSPDRAFT_897855 [Athelia psychrophila]|uniref:Uncharacterized protein n=1 Tax=Athelia psychrophila TaxID=1759441 RepID=A0A166BPQ0_9AGAM|nr:hypothetical protein FIBSPDRAFT_897855 [Fibularhizoctonia sp. CBS 109695]
MASVAVSTAEKSLSVNYIQTAMFTLTTPQVLAWDILICLAEELKVAIILGFCPSIVIYYISRFLKDSDSCNGLVASIADCQVFWHVLSATSTIGGAATSFLFFLRVRAVYEKSLPVTIAFGIFWLAIPVACSLLNISTHAFGIWAMHAIGLWVKAAYDTSVFAAVTWRIIIYTAADHAPKSQRWRLIRGAGMPRIYRDLLRGGQQFYLRDADGSQRSFSSCRFS